MTGGRSWGEYTGPFFRADSVWRKRLPDLATIDPDSDAVVEQLANRAMPTRTWTVNYGQPTAREIAGISGFNYRSWNTPLYVAKPGNYTRQRIYVDRPYGQIPANATLRSAMADVPVPDDARPAGPWPGVGGVPTGSNPGDNHLIIYSHPTNDFMPDTMWECWKARELPIDPPSDNIQAVGTDPAILNAAGWHCVYGAALKNVSKYHGAGYDNTAWNGEGQGWGSSAAKLPLVGGLIRQEEALAAAAGDINAIQHAIRFHILGGKVPSLQTGAGGVRWPGYGGDGSSQHPYAPAEGMIFRLPPSYDTSTEPDPFMAAVNTAIRDYGLIGGDTAGACAIILEPRNQVANTHGEEIPDIWLGTNGLSGPAGNGVFSDYNTTLASQKIPWAQMQLLDRTYRPTAPRKSRLTIGVA